MTDFSGQTIVVTGSNVGLGKEAARHFARLNAAKVILAVRNLEQGEEVKKSIETTTNRSGVVEVWKLDLSSFDSVKEFAKRATSELKRLDALMLNASIAAGGFRMNEGYEASITVNVLSTFLLMFMILPIMEKTAKMSPPLPPRICITTSEVHTWVKLPPADYPEGKMLASMSNEATNKDKITNRRYPESKLLQVLLVRAIAPLMQKSNGGVVLNMLNPGLCHSALSRDSGIMLEIVKFFLARSTEVGSRTLVASAEVGKESHGKYMTDSSIAYEGQSDGISAWARSEDGKLLQERLWTEVRGILNEIQPGVTKVIE